MLVDRRRVQLLYPPCKGGVISDIRTAHIKIKNQDVFFKMDSNQNLLYISRGVLPIDLYTQKWTYYNYLLYTSLNLRI